MFPHNGLVTIVNFWGELCNKNYLRNPAIEAIATMDHFSCLVKMLYGLAGVLVVGSMVFAGGMTSSTFPASVSVNSGFVSWDILRDMTAELSLYLLYVACPELLGGGGDRPMSQYDRDCHQNF